MLFLCFIFLSHSVKERRNAVCLELRYVPVPIRVESKVELENQLADTKHEGEEMKR